MRISYNIPTQTVSLEIAPDEVKEINQDVRANIQTLFADTVSKMREQIAAIKEKVS